MRPEAKRKKEEMKDARELRNKKGGKNLTKPNKKPYKTEKKTFDRKFHLQKHSKGSL